MIREWAFETVTVGIEVHVPQSHIISCIRQEMLGADAIIVNTTPRMLDYLTLEWAQNEIGTAFG
jgi:hypothetical protein